MGSRRFNLTRFDARAAESQDPVGIPDTEAGRLGDDAERVADLEHESPLAKDDAFPFENEVYSVVDVQPGHGDFDGVIAAEWKGELARPVRALDGRI